MPGTEFHRLVEQVGYDLAAFRGEDSAAIMLHAEADEGYVSPSLFEDYDEKILYRDGLQEFSYTILDLWQATEPSKRWSEMIYVLRGSSFTLDFIYKDVIDPEEEPLDRRTRIVIEKFGDKPIIYPPSNEDNDDIFEL